MILFLLVLIGVASSSFTFESSNYPNRFIRHRGWLLYLDPKADTDLFRKDSTFRVVRGLYGGNNFVSFESINYPQHYIRHAGYRARIARFDGSDLFKKDASFKKVPALDGKPGFYSFESNNYPNFFLRHRGFELWLDRNDGSALFKKDASFTFNPDFDHCRNGQTGSVLPFSSIQVSESTLMIALGLIAVIFIINIVFLFNMCSKKRKKKGYAAVKYFDSDCEAEAINK